MLLNRTRSGRKEATVRRDDARAGERVDELILGREVRGGGGVARGANRAFHAPTPCAFGSAEESTRGRAEKN